METELKKRMIEAIEKAGEKGTLKRCRRCGWDEFAISEIATSEDLKSGSAPSSIAIICLNCGIIVSYTLD